jgi:hypothetical protein
MKRDPENGKPSFQTILNDVASQNARNLMGRARLANMIAKSLRGSSRARAYAIKSHALLELTTRFPERVRILNDFRTPRFVLVKARRARFGLHAPAELFREG